MEIKTQSEKVSNSVDVTTALYTRRDVEKLIENDLRQKGFGVKSIQPKVSFEYVYDEWGMGRDVQTRFEGIAAVVTQTG